MRLDVVAALIALVVLGGAAWLIVRGDVTPGAHRSSPHRTEPIATPANVMQRATIAPVSEATVAPAEAATPGPTAEPLARPVTMTPSPQTSSAARLALIIDDCGQWPDTEHGFIALGVPLTMSVLPHVRYGSEIAHDAQAAGKGVMLHLPMEPQSGIDPGPGKIMTAMDDTAIAAQVRDDLASVPLADGVNNHEGSRATSDDRVMRDVAAVLAERHVFFVDSRTAATTVAERDVSAAGVPTAGRDVFLDNVAEVAATEAHLRRAAEIAKSKGSAIAIGHPRPTTLEAVRAMLPELQRDGVAFVLVRDLVHESKP